MELELSMAKIKRKSIKLYEQLDELYQGELYQDVVYLDELFLGEL